MFFACSLRWTFFNNEQQAQRTNCEASNELSTAKYQSPHCSPPVPGCSRSDNYTKVFNSIYKLFRNAFLQCSHLQVGQHAHSKRQPQEGSKIATIAHAARQKHHARLLLQSGALALTCTRTRIFSASNGKEQQQNKIKKSRQN